MNIIVLGLSITSSWGNGHATTYRGLVRELGRRGHNVWFLERNKPWYAPYRDVNHVADCEICLYDSVFELQKRFGDTIAEADAVIVGSYVPEGIAVGEWVTSIANGVTAFYDIDTPVTLEDLGRDVCDYLTAELVGAYDIYLSFSGGPLLESLKRIYGAQRTAALYCSVDPRLYFPENLERRWELGYLGTYTADRQAALEGIVKTVEQRVVVAGPQYPTTIAWPPNVERIEHLAPGAHRQFYSQQRFTLNLTRAAMIAAGYSPSVRLFEAAACGVPIISDRWPGIETLFVSGEEILLVDRPTEVREILLGYSEDESMEIGWRARERILLSHTAAHRAHELEELIQLVLMSKHRVLEETT